MMRSIYIGASMIACTLVFAGGWFAGKLADDLPIICNGEPYWILGNGLIVTQSAVKKICETISK